MARFNIEDAADEVVSQFGSWVEDEADQRVYDEVDFDKIRQQMGKRMAADSQLMKNTKSTVIDTLTSELRLSFRSFMDAEGQSTDRMVKKLRENAGTFISTAMSQPRPPSGV